MQQGISASYVDRHKGERANGMFLLLIEHDVYEGGSLDGGGEFKETVRDRYNKILYSHEQYEQAKAYVDGMISGEYSPGGNGGSSENGGVWIYRRNSRVYDVLKDKEAAKFIFEAEWERAEDFTRWLIGATIHELTETPESIKAKYSVDYLRRVAMGRLKAAGLLETCGRCGGSGNFSYNQRDGSRCYGCEGAKMRLPRRITKKWKKSVEEHNFNQSEGQGG